MITFHKMIAGCDAGEREAWLSFAATYTPVAYRLFDVYFGSQAVSARERENFWRGALESLAENRSERLRRFEHQAEREFLSDFRLFLLERGRSRLDPALDEPASPQLTPETVRALLDGLPLLHQEIAFFKLAGYSDATIESILRITPVVAQKGIERLEAAYALALDQERDQGKWPAAWLEVLRHAWSAKTESCAPLRQFIRIHDGQTSWYDKEPVEQHMTGCLHCLERWTALREMEYLRNRTSRFPATEIETLVRELPFPAGTKKHGSFVRRMLG